MASPRKLRGPQLELAGELCVAFVNTAGARKNNRQLGVGSYAELLAWGQQAGLVSASETERLKQGSAERQEEAEAVFASAAVLRSALTRIFFSIAADRAMAPDDLDVVNQAFAKAMSWARLVPTESGMTLGWAGNDHTLDRMLWPVLHSVSNLMISLKGQPRVRQCKSPECELFFVDRAPANRRTWCDSKVCGHRLQALRYYHQRAKRLRSISMSRLT